MWSHGVRPTLLVGLFLVGVGSAAVYYVHELHERSARVLDKNATMITAAGDMQVALWSWQTHLNSTPDQRNGRLVSQYRADFERALASSENYATTASETRILTQIQAHYAEFLASARAPAAASESPDRNSVAVQIAEACTDLRELNQQSLADSIDQQRGLSTAMLVIGLLLIAAGPVTGIGLALRRGRRGDAALFAVSAQLTDIAMRLKRQLGGAEADKPLVHPPTNPPMLEQQVKDLSQLITHIVTERDQTRDEATRAERLAAIGELAAGVAHELRNPLTSIKLLIQMAARKEGTQFTPKQLQVLQDEIIRMEATIQGLLDFARPNKLRPVAHDLRETLRRAITLAKSKQGQTVIEIVEDLPANPLMAEGDPDQLQQVFVNLLMNGIEAMPGGGALHVRLRPPCTPADRCHIEFIDSGSGIPEQILDRIFEPFVSGKKRGHGLGLAVSGAIVKGHGGRIVAANRPEGGASFIVELPCTETMPLRSSAESAPSLSRVDSPRANNGHAGHLPSNVNAMAKAAESGAHAETADH